MTVETPETRNALGETTAEHIKRLEVDLESLKAAFERLNRDLRGGRPWGPLTH